MSLLLQPPKLGFGICSYFSISLIPNSPIPFFSIFFGFPSSVLLRPQPVQFLSLFLNLSHTLHILSMRSRESVFQNILFFSHLCEC